MPRSPALLALCAAAVLLIAGCASTPDAAPARLDRPETPVPAAAVAAPVIAATEAIAPAKPLTPAQRTVAELHILTGELAAERGQPGLAAREFLSALDLVDDVELAKRAVSLALQAGDRDLALGAAQRWQRLEPNELDPREVVLRISVEKGDGAEALAQGRAIVSGHAGGEDDGLQYTARLLTQSSAKAAETALEVMRKLVALYPQRSTAQQGLAIVALRHGRIELAEQAARQARVLAPKSREPAVLLAGVLVRQNQLAEADQLFESIIAAEKDPADLRLGYAKLLIEAGQREAARAQLRKALAVKPGQADALYALGVLDLNDRNYDAAESQFRLALNSERAQDAAFQLGLIAEQRRDYTRALDYYERVSSGVQAVEAAVRRGHVLAQTQRVPESRALMSDLRRQLPQLSPRLYIAEAEILGSVDQDEQALAVFETALKSTPDSADLLYARSLLHEKRRRIDLAELDLRNMLKNDADDARAMNALGYMLTVHTQRYREARKLIERALELEPDDAAIMDSLGWVQFKLGKPDEARELLQKALARAPDPEIAAHLGEVLWTLGEKDNARAVWEQALKRTPDHPALNDTVKRLAQ